MKYRLVAGRNKKQGTIEKSEATSPKSAPESVLLTENIDANEECDVATIDIPNAFVHTRLKNKEDRAVMHLQGKISELMVNVEPEVYNEYIAINLKGKTILYVHQIIALYCIIKVELLQYKRFVKDLKSIGFTLNPYEPCISNIMVRGKQLAVVWHTDDLKLSHW